MNNVPEIRFEGFDGVWEQRKLGEESEIFAGGDIDKDKILEFGNYPVFANALTNDGIVGYYDNHFRIEAPAVTVTGRGDVGHAKARKISFTPVVRLLAIKSEHNVDFLENAINNHNVFVEFTGVPQLTAPQLAQCIIPFPTLPEQTAIGNFFCTLDETLALCKRKLDGLRELKRGYLQLMFPQAGESVPRVRFAGFEGEWVERKLGEVFEQTAQYVNPKVDDIELWSLTVESGLTPKTERYNREFLVKKDDAFKVVMPDEFIYNPMNMTLGAVDLNRANKKVAVSGYYITMRTKEKYDNGYFAMWLKSPLAITLYKTYATGGLIEKQRVQFPTLSSIDTLVPSLPEQTAIGNFFRNLDEQITAQQTKCDKLKQLKAAYLQKMFV